MRYSALYVETVHKWAVVDALSGDFALELFDTEKAAQLAAKTEENRWNILLNSTQPARAAS
jgi:3-methyladenine DNA glycosylase AlkD